MVLLYQIFIIPFMLAFQVYTTNLVRTDMFCDGLLLFELIFHFFYGFVNKRQVIENKFWPIAKSYLFGMFIFDLLALFPYYMVDSWQDNH